jgi:hypothetical protein
MKKIIVLLSACLLISLMGFTQKLTPDKVPAPVKQAFEKKFPTAIDVSYEMEKKDYEVIFKDKEVSMSANFNSKGEWLETETVITESDLPKKVSHSIAKNFAGYKISEVTKIDGPNKVVNYEMDLNKDKLGYEVKFSSKGDILKRTPLKKEKN